MLEEKVVRRGEVWWISSGSSSDWEQNFGRPAVVISGDVGNERTPMVIVAFVTSQQRKPSPIYPKVMFPEGERRVLANQIYTVDKSRLDRKICTLTDPEMVRVGGALAIAMCIPQYPKKSEIEEPKTNDTVALRCEADMWRRMYEKVMDQLVEIRVTADVATKMEPKKPVVKSGLREPDLGYEEENVPKESEPKKEKKSEPGKNNGIVWDGVKVNVNTVKTATELRNRTGMAMNTCLEILKTRKIVGKYDTLDDLLALEKFGETSMKRYGHMLTVTEGETEKKNSQE